MCKDVEKLIEAVGLRRIISGFSPCYEGLVKDIVVSVPTGCDDANDKDYKTVIVRGKMVNLSSNVINEFIRRSVEPQPELEVTDDQVCREVTGEQVKH